MSTHIEHHMKGTVSRTIEKRSLLIALVLTVTIMFVEFIGGVLANSIALVSDAGHMLTDALALSLSFFALILATRPANARKTYGYYRLEILAALVNGVILTVIALGIFYTSYQRFISPKPIRTELLLIVAVIGFFANIVSLTILSAKRSNLNIRGAFLHVLGDTLSSLGVIIGGIIILLTGWEKIDAIIGIIIGGVIIYGSFKLIKESVDILLEAIPAGIELVKVSDTIESIEGVKAVHDLHIWCITTGMVALSGHIVVPNEFLDRGDEILNMVKRKLKDRFQIDHTTIQIESEQYGECEEKC